MTSVFQLQPYAQKFWRGFPAAVVSLPNEVQ